MSIEHAFPVPDRPSRAATPPAKLGRVCSWIHRCPRFALGVVDFSRLSAAAGETTGRSSRRRNNRPEPRGIMWGGEVRRAPLLRASAAAPPRWCAQFSSRSCRRAHRRQPPRSARDGPPAPIQAHRAVLVQLGEPHAGEAGLSCRPAGGMGGRAAESALGARTTSYGRRMIPHRCSRCSAPSSGNPGLTSMTNSTRAG